MSVFYYDFDNHSSPDWEIGIFGGNGPGDVDRVVGKVMTVRAESHPFCTQIISLMLSSILPVPGSLPYTQSCTMLLSCYIYFKCFCKGKREQGLIV